MKRNIKQSRAIEITMNINIILDIYLLMYLLTKNQWYLWEKFYKIATIFFYKYQRNWAWTSDLLFKILISATFPKTIKMMRTSLFRIITAGSGFFHRRLTRKATCYTVAREIRFVILNIRIMLVNRDIYTIENIIEYWSRDK